jgi:dTDP-4-dehydrorhamnose 3,5-epimerase
MRFSPTNIAGVVLIDLDSASDHRGSFARLHCPEAFAAAGWPFTPAQTSLSRNIAALTMRGLHYRADGHEETKLVRVVRGRTFEVAVDVRADSPTYGQWLSVELSADNGRAILVGGGVAHGFLTLEPDTDVLYQISPAYEPGYDLGVRWNDPAFAVVWPAEPAVISERDAGWADHVRGL